LVRMVHFLKVLGSYPGGIIEKESDLKNLLDNELYPVPLMPLEIPDS